MKMLTEPLILILLKDISYLQKRRKICRDFMFQIQKMILN